MNKKAVDSRNVSSTQAEQHATKEDGITVAHNHEARLSRVRDDQATSLAKADALEAKGVRIVDFGILAELAAPPRPPGQPLPEIGCEHERHVGREIPSPRETVARGRRVRRR